MNIKRDDTIVVLSGKDKGKQGKVLVSDPKGGKVIVQGINVATVHKRPAKQGDEGGIIKKETPIYVSKVMLVCPKCGKGTRVGHKFVEGKDGKLTKMRVCKKCSAEF